MRLDGFPTIRLLYTERNSTCVRSGVSELVGIQVYAYYHGFVTGAWRRDALNAE